MSPLQTGKAVRVVYAEETIFGTPPAAAGAKQLRFTEGSSGLKLTRARVDSREVRSDGQTAVPRLGSKSVSGGYGVELSPGEADDLLAALLRGTWTADVLTPGSVLRSFTFEEQHLDIDASETFSGVRISSARFSLAPDGIMTVEFTLVGADGEMLEGASAPYFTAPYALTTTDPLASADSALEIDGVPVLTFTSCEFTLDRRAAAQPVIGSQVTPDVFTNNLTIEGSISTLRADASLQADYLAEATPDLVITLTAPSGTASYTVTLPRIKFLDYTKNLGNDNAMIASMPFVAGVDPTAGNMISIARTV